MATLRDIKGRIRSVTTTQKTTKAMNLVSSSKMARAKVKLNRSQPFFDEVRRVIGNIVIGSGEVEHKYFVERKIKRSLIIIIANDRGLCGGYNSNICKLASTLSDNLQKEDKEVRFYCIGNKSRDFFRRANADIMGFKNGISENPFYEDAVELAQMVMPLYETGEIDEVYVCYTEFVSAITYIPKSVRILPLDKEDFVNESTGNAEFIKFEPSPIEVLDYVVPKYLATIILSALSTSAAAGQAATMTAMDSATENAENIIENLTLLKNRVRQAAITQEISEIVGGANALD
jgi:F-type H+-transporting ATPase subunit gamma